MTTAYLHLRRLDNGGIKNRPENETTKVNCDGIDKNGDAGLPVLQGSRKSGDYGPAGQSETPHAFACHLFFVDSDMVGALRDNGSRRL